MNKFDAPEALIPSAIGKLSARVADLRLLVGEIEQVLGMENKSEPESDMAKPIGQTTIQERARQIDTYAELLDPMAEKLRRILGALQDL